MYVSFGHFHIKYHTHIFRPRIYRDTLHRRPVQVLSAPSKIVEKVVKTLVLSLRGMSFIIYFF